MAEIQMRWSSNHLPAIGQWLKAPRGRTAYEITGIRPRRRHKTKGYNFIFTVVRHPPSEIPPGATVHEFRWDSRAPKRRHRLNELEGQTNG